MINVNIGDVLNRAFAIPIDMYFTDVKYKITVIELNNALFNKFRKAYLMHSYWFCRVCG